MSRKQRGFAIAAVGRTRSRRPSRPYRPWLGELLGSVKLLACIPSRLDILDNQLQTCQT